MKVTWDKFASKNEDVTSAFESLCSIVFSSISGAKVQRVPKNYPGLEAKPVANPLGKICSYQSKFFKVENSKDQITQIKKSLNAISDNDLQSLDTVYMFVNSIASGVESACDKFWKTHQKNKKVSINLEWHYGIDFFIGQIADKEFDGVRSMFFGAGRPMQLNDSNYTNEFLDARSQSYYIDLPFIKNSKSVSIKNILNDKSKYILIQSRAGTGKSWLTSELSYRIGGVSLDYRDRQLQLYKKGLVVCFTANELTRTSVIDCFMLRLTSFNIKPFDYPITLIVDAVDEVEHELMRQLVDGLSHLQRSGHAERIIITSRAASINGKIISTVLKPSTYEIAELNDVTIQKYFDNRANRKKIRLIKSALKQKIDLSAIRNIRMLEVAWNIATTIDDFSLENMFEKRLSSQIDKLRPKMINLLEPIEPSIESILQEQAYKLQKNEVFDFALSEMQNTILELFSRLSYNDVNIIIRFLESICLDTTRYNLGRLQFEHRSWVDYFTARYLTEKFENADKKSLIEFAAYEDFLIKWFVPVARKTYIAQGKVVPAIAVGYVEWYAKEDWVSWVDEDSEIICDINVAKYNPVLEESITTSIKLSDRLSIIKEAYDSGMTEAAKSAFARIKRKLKTDRKIDDSLWKEFVSYYYLLIIIDKTKPISTLVDLQRIVKINKSEKFELGRIDSDNYSSKLVELTSMLITLKVSSEEILEAIEQELMPHFFHFLILPNTVRILRKNETLRNKVFESLSDEAEILLTLHGLVDDKWSVELEQQARAVLTELNEHTHQGYMYPLSYNIRRLSMLRILSYWDYQKLGGYDDSNTSSYHVVTQNDIFNHLYSLIVLKDFRDELLTKFVNWINEAKHHIYSSNGNAGNSLKRAVSSLLSTLLKEYSHERARMLLRSLRLDSGKSELYSAYILMLDIFKSDQVLFKKLFRYEDVLLELDESRDDLYDRQVTLKNFAPIIGIYNQQDLLKYTADSKAGSRLKYGYRKDTIGFFMIEAMKVMFEDNIYSSDDIKNYVWRAYNIILRILDITDGKSTSWLPDYMFEVLCTHDMEFADEVYTSYKDDYPYEDHLVLTIIIKGAISRGDSYESILDRMKGYHPSMLEPGMVTPSFYEQQIICLSKILESDAYSTDNKEDALNKISSHLNSLIQEAKNTRWSYKPDSFSNDLKSAAKIYRVYKSRSNQKSSLSVFPLAHKQKDTFGETYDLKKRESGKNAKLALMKSSSKSDVKKIISDYLGYGRGYGYGYLLCNEVGAKLFVSKLEEFKVPYDDVKSYVGRCMEQHSYGKASINFAIAMWSSSYRGNMMKDFVNGMHYTDNESLLILFRKDKDHASVRQLIDHTTEFIELLVRKEQRYSRLTKAA